MSEQHFGNWLRRKIAELPMSLSEFARHAQVSRSVLMSWLRQARPHLRADNVTRIASGLQVERDEVEQLLNNGSTASAA